MANKNDLIQNIHNAFSFEICAHKNLDWEKLRTIQPKFCSVPWHIPSMKNLETLDIPALNFAEKLINKGYKVLLHLTGRDLSRNEASLLLEKIKTIGIKHLLVLQGDESVVLRKKTTKPDFCYAVDLIRYIKEKYGDYFELAVAGYPEGHPDSKNNLDDFKYFVEKVQAGADYVITQATFDYEKLMNFLRICKEARIDAPILPGLYVFSAYESLMRMCKFCHLQLPTYVTNILEKNKNNPQAIKNFSLYYHINFIKRICMEPKINLPGIHLYTLNNLEVVESIKLGLFDFKIERPLALVIQK